MYHPSRGGVRGGSDQFEWDDIKADKHRENYLGHSLMAPVGRWQKNKDLQWFSREKKGSADKAKQEERDAIKRMEAEAMAAALGKGPVKKVQNQQLSKQELAEVLKKGQSERDDKDIERVEGMGFGSSRASLVDTSMTSNTKETLSAIGSNQDSAKQKMEKIETAPDSISKKERKEKNKKKKKKKEKHKHKKKKSKVHSESSRTRRRHDSESGSEDQSSLKKRERHDSNSADDSREQNYSTKKDRKSKSHDGDNWQRKSHRKKRNDSSDDDWSRKYKRKSTMGGEGKYSSRTRHDSSDDDDDQPRKSHKKDDKEREGTYSSRMRHDSSSDDDQPRKHHKKN